MCYDFDQCRGAPGNCRTTWPSGSTTTRCGRSAGKQISTTLASPTSSGISSVLTPPKSNAGLQAMVRGRRQCFRVATSTSSSSVTIANELSTSPLAVHGFRKGLGMPEPTGSGLVLVLVLYARSQAPERERRPFNRYLTREAVRFAQQRRIGCSWSPRQRSTIATSRARAPRARRIRGVRRRIRSRSSDAGDSPSSDLARRRPRLEAGERTGART